MTKPKGSALALLRKTLEGTQGDFLKPMLLTKARLAVLKGTAWQRCRVHFMRNLLSRVSKHAQGFVSATVRHIYAQPDRSCMRCNTIPMAERTCHHDPPCCPQRA